MRFRDGGNPSLFQDSVASAGLPFHLIPKGRLDIHLPHLKTQIEFLIARFAGLS